MEVPSIPGLGSVVENPRGVSLLGDRSSFLVVLKMIFLDLKLSHRSVRNSSGFDERELSQKCKSREMKTDQNQNVVRRLSSILGHFAVEGGGPFLGFPPQKFQGWSSLGGVNFWDFC